MEEEQRTLEQIEDNELAKLFLYKNHESQDNSSASISNIFVSSREEFFKKNPAPSPELHSRLEKENSEATITASIEKVIQGYHKRKLILKKISEIFSVRVRKKGELMGLNIPFLGANYRYFYTYLENYKKSIKNAWTEFNSFIEILFKAPGNFDKLKKFEFKSAGILLGLLFFLLIARIFLNNWDSVRSVSPHSQFFSNWISSIVIICSIACIAILFPYIVLGIFYFININYLYQTKYFHYFLLSCTFLATVLFSVAFCNFLIYQAAQLWGGWGIVNITVQEK
ncbi:hypothetical protein OVS_01230 [Mycoplasma ovis str. Michigan]|uniref:Uncharacterized protein n=1 Tax=Mycoplasma ovis str. Michigan TaxID=1415773 RepID=A0ABM5P0D0_9MOLU|nr:hypothetical protein [Mycoplasma ovis]AHC39871.1 hypothetical protein OVS_01230 [Mycoplasma ovis str. Michigan]